MNIKNLSCLNYSLESPSFCGQNKTTFNKLQKITKPRGKQASRYGLKNTDTFQTKVSHITEEAAHQTSDSNYPANQRQKMIQTYFRQIKLYS